MEKFTELKKINLFANFSEAELKKVSQQLERREYKKKEIIFDSEEGENFIFIVSKGKVRVYISYPNGKEFTLAILEPGDIYSSHGDSSTEALEEVTLLTMDLKSFKELLMTNPLISLQMMHVVGKCLRSSIHIIEGLAFKDVNHRIAEFLVEKFKESGKKTSEGIVLELGLTNEELATIVGATRQSVSTFMNELKREGVLKRLPRKKLLIKDLSKLRK